MIFRRTQNFKKHFEKLSPPLQNATKKSFSLFKDNPTFPHHPSLKIKPLKGSSDIWEGHITRGCVFTFHKENDNITGEPIIVFRNIGSHDIYNNP